MKHLTLYENFLNEDGYGRDYFIRKKEGKVYNYFFKIEGEEDELGFIVSLGKLSRNITIESAENSYAVISVQPMSTNIMDDYLVSDSDFRSREDESFSLSKSEFMRFYKIVGEAIKDYLQNNPKVSTIYDEIPLNLEKDLKDYMSGAKVLMDTWSYNKWSLQEGPSSKIVIYKRRDHE
jgi:hypothetical protein